MKKILQKILIISAILSTSLLLTSCENSEEQKIMDDLDLEIKEFLEKNPESDLDKILDEKDELEIIEEKSENTKTEMESEELSKNSNNNENENKDVDFEIVKTIEDFVKCITKNGAKVYGTTWCGHCKTQKAMFGDASKNLDFIDCDTDRKGCKDAGITGYPTWKIQGELFPGVQNFEMLGKKTGCKLEVTE